MRRASLSGSSLEDVQAATIQIVATGSFVEPSGLQTAVAGSGTGFIIDSAGIAVTNNHVVAGAAKLVVDGGETTNTSTETVEQPAEEAAVASDNGFVTLTDDLDALSVSVPATWSDISTQVG